MQHERLKKLAKSIEALAAKDQLSIRRADAIQELRRQAAVGLHGACADFVSELNAMLPSGEVKLDPPAYGPESFLDSGKELFQINVRGRILQIEFQPTSELLSTENFRAPYALEGSVRCFNQELLEKNLIEEQLLFYCVDKSGGIWRFFDARTYRTGPFDQDYLISLFEQLV